MAGGVKPNQNRRPRRCAKTAAGAFCCLAGERRKPGSPQLPLAALLLELLHAVSYTHLPVLAVLGCSDKLGIQNSDDMRAYLEGGNKFSVGVPSMSGFGYVAAAAMFDQMGIMDNVTWVTYDGAPALYQAYLSGEIDFATFDDNFAAQYANSGDAVTVGVVMNDVRSQMCIRDSLYRGGDDPLYRRGHERPDHLFQRDRGHHLGPHLHRLLSRGVQRRPVSYTHLDVYKRQVTMRKNIKA